MRDQDSPDVESGGALNTDVEINTWHIPEYCWFSCFCVCKFVLKDTQLSDHLLENEGSGVPRCSNAVVSQADVESNT